MTNASFKSKALKLLLALHHAVTPVKGPHVQTGKASYYDNAAYGGPGHCAHRTIPKGTRVHVVGAHGAIDCTVDDRGPYVTGRIIDLNAHDFSTVAGGTSAGVTQVTVTW